VVQRQRALADIGQACYDMRCSGGIHSAAAAFASCRSEYWCLFVNLRDIDDLTEDWAAVKLIPRRTGLPRSVWITENQGYQHDVRVKVSRLRSGGGTWLDAVSVSVRPICEEIVPPGRQPELPAADLALLSDWIALNRDVIIDFWNGTIDYLEAGARLQRLP